MKPLHTYSNLSALAVLLASISGVRAETTTAQQPLAQPAPKTLYIQEYRVRGAHVLPRIEVEKAVYSYMGPGRSEVDVEQARQALEKAYKDKGFQTVEVQVPQQSGSRGIIFLDVVERKVGRLRVKGSRYFSLEQIKRMAPSLAEGKVVNFNDVTRDILALNQLPDRRVTPSLRAGVEEGTVDIDLEVKDTFPLHGSLELNNRNSPNTTDLRLNGSLSYNNLWQAGHSAGVSFQVAPEDISEAAVYSAYYLVRFPTVPWFSMIFQGTKQDSDVSTLGGAAVNGRGEIYGIRALISLPPGKDFYHSLSLGVDYKHFDQTLRIGLDEILTPITYYPISASYTASWIQKTNQTELNLGVTAHIRGTGSDEQEFTNNRFKSGGNFIYLRGDLSHTHDLPFGFQLYGKIQGQIASQPLVSSEQFTGGGVGTARGYFEGEVAGDDAGFATLEVRTMNLLPWLKDRGSEWRVYSFFDCGFLSIKEPLPGQEDYQELASVGFGTSIQLFDHYHGSFDLAMPLIAQGQTRAHDFQANFRLWADF